MRMTMGLRMGRVCMFFYYHFFSLPWHESLCIIFLNLSLQLLFQNQPTALFLRSPVSIVYVFLFKIETRLIYKHTLSHIILQKR